MEILENLDYFSSLTQETLSAFHFSGIDSSLYEDIEDLKKTLLKTKHRVLITASWNSETKKYKRVFQDGFVDEVDESDLRTPSVFSDTPLSIKLSEKPSPIYSIKMGELIYVNQKDITSVLEKLFLS